MRNILYIGPYRENNGLGRSSRRFVSALASNPNINLSCRPIFFTNQLGVSQHELSFISQFEDNLITNVECLIQHGYPDMLEYHKNFGKNIAITEIETENINHTGWIEKLNLMDEVWVGSIAASESLFKSNIDTMVNVIPEPYNIEKYNEPISKDFFDTNDIINDPFIFYTIGGYKDKKNIQGIILAFLLEFNIYDNVRLFIKTGGDKVDNTSLETQINNDISKIYKCIRKSPLGSPRIDVLCGDLDNDAITRLHKSSDCYVDSVRADSNASCAIEALLSDNLVITTKNIASNSYINFMNGFVVDSIKSNVYTSDYFYKNSFTIYEEWNEPILPSLQRQMREAYNLSDNRRSKTDTYNKNRFDYRNIGEMLYEYCI
jgi:hypothetical protein